MRSAKGAVRGLHPQLQAVVVVAKDNRFRRCVRRNGEFRVLRIRLCGDVSEMNELHEAVPTSCHDLCSKLGFRDSPRSATIHVEERDRITQIREDAVCLPMTTLRHAESTLERRGSGAIRGSGGRALPKRKSAEDAGTTAATSRLGGVSDASRRQAAAVRSMDHRTTETRACIDGGHRPQRRSGTRARGCSERTCGLTTGA